MHLPKRLVFFILFSALSLSWAWGEGDHDGTMTHEVTRLFLQLGVIILCAKLAGRLAKKLHLPALLGEVTAGIIIGPYALGAVTIPGFADGLVPLSNGSFPISLQLYGFAAVGAIIHVLVVGLESDMGLFAKTRQRGFAIALSSSLMSLLAGVFVGTVLFGFPLLDRRVFFIAALSVSTALGVQARILHSQKKMSSPEGSAIVSASLLQDGFAIIFLAIAMAFGTLELGAVEDLDIWSAALPVTLLALGILAGGIFLTFLGAPRISAFFRKHHNSNIFLVLVVGLALVLSGIFEAFGVAAIIGAYVLGLAFSRTDLGDVLAEKSQPLSEFFVPVLYVVMGMLVDFRVLVDPAIMVPALSFAFISGAAKFIGAGIPALGSGFTRWGALRVGLGTIPRGEVALIIASVGLALNDFPLELFQIMVVMIVFSVALGSPLFALSLRRGGGGTKGTWSQIEMETTAVDLPSEELSDLIADRLVRVAERDGFYVHRLELAETVYRMRRDEVYMTIHKHPNKIEIVNSPQDSAIAKTLLYEVIVHVKDRMARITQIVVPEELRRDVVTKKTRATLDLSQFLDSQSVIPQLKSSSKEGAIQELVQALAQGGKLLDEKKVLSDALEREASSSTGMEKGLAIPHCRTDGVDSIHLAFGRSMEGLDFQAFDSKPCHFIFLIASSSEHREPHLQLLAAIAKQMRDEERHQDILKAQSAKEIMSALLK